MERFSLAASADYDPHAKERLVALDAKLTAAGQEQQVRTPTTHYTIYALR